ncbi:MAG TPA: wax ester/triacylglycerol synthase family O-acyltransferase [Kofleriaceae bacterium]|nr:wax ester/triacylglycerol synthase family O-acyltransferase [Kofleriaceae bacterium]
MSRSNGESSSAPETTALPAMERLRVLDAQFLHLEDERQPMHIAGLCIFEGPPPTPEEITRLYSGKLALIPRYRRRVRFLPLELGRPVWVDDPHFNLDYHVRRTALPAPGDDAALCALMGQLMSQRLDRSRPLWEVWIIEGLQGGRWALVSKVHHSMVDGVSGVDLTAVVLDAEPDCPPPSPVPWTPEPEPSGVAKVLDAWRGLAHDTRRLANGAVAMVRHPARGARELRDFGAGLATFARRLLNLRTGALQGNVGAHRAYACASASLADVQTIRKALGGTVNDVVLAAVSGGYRALLQARNGHPEAARVRSLVPVSTRAPDEHGLLDNRVSALLCDLPVDVADPVERLHAVRAETERLKSSHMAESGAEFLDLGSIAPPFIIGPLTHLVMRVMHHVPQRMFATVTTNIPGPRTPLYCLGRKMLEWYPYVPIGQGLRVGTAILSYAGRLGFGVTSDYDTIQDASALARGIVQGLAELLERAQAQTAGVAPAAPAQSTPAGTRASQDR